MTLVDTHTHLYDEQLTADPQQIQRAIEAGVTKMYMPNCDSSTIEGMLAMETAYPQNCFPMMGLHPVYVKENYKDELTIVENWLSKRKFAGVGEIGLDYYWDKTFVPQQKEAFEQQIDWALQYDLPIIIHSRESTADCIEIVRKKQNGKLRGIFHCFSGTLEEAKQIQELGFYLGIGGVVTFKKSTLPEIVREMPLETLVLETDAPYLAPVPYRGKRNESSYIPLIAMTIATIKQVGLDEISAITNKNAEKIFSM
ncbi:TatD family hydrolase [Taibaiella soli]|uniref:Hydrolase TatD n=1 Tax=Taibaiella soli TaxID=1649169 RepID=A0A2W2A803_9BACT|nr:TatD family hydrolase [Taibaiella soli]PZF71391.1 hydrolase TatD [Taibaiella soli]